MAHHYVNQLIHVMWSTHRQQYTFPLDFKNSLYPYITALAKSKNVKVLAIGGSTDHLHLLIVLPPDLSLSTLMGYVKAYSSKWIKSYDFIDPKFSWQEGFLALSTQTERLDKVYAYIQSDETRHDSQSYQEELCLLLEQQDILYKKSYFLNTSFSKLYTHLIWSTNERQHLLDPSIQPLLYNQIKLTVDACGGILHEIGGMEDHVHLLIEAPKNKSISDVIRELKTCSTHWLKSIDQAKHKAFEWQSGYGAFTVSLSHFEVVKKYIQNQKEHHRQHSTQEEWNIFLQNNSSLFAQGVK